MCCYGPTSSIPVHHLSGSPEASHNKASRPLFPPFPLFSVRSFRVFTLWTLLRPLFSGDERGLLQFLHFPRIGFE